ncbi:MAG: hypothetical protein WD397_01990 [Wenzhouxiangellaceae bacterium]
MLVRHFARLPAGLVVLWCFLIWYLVMVMLHFEASFRLWLNALGMSVIVGTALMLSVSHSGSTAREFWRVFRLYAIPFCVSSFSALVRDDGFYAIFAPQWGHNLIALNGCALFLVWILLARRLDRHIVTTSIDGECS